MQIFITGATGFIGKNLSMFLVSKGYKIVEYNKNQNLYNKFKNLKKNDIIIHLAGTNRSTQKKNFIENNINLTKKICNIIERKKVKVKIIFASSTQINKKTMYGFSKLESEKVLKSLNKRKGVDLKILRIPNVYGKWCKPNYNSVVATFCYNISKNKKIRIINKDKILKLIYIDDLIQQIYEVIKNKNKILYPKIVNTTKITVNELALKIKNCSVYFKKNIYFDVNNDFLKKLYSTYLSYVSSQNILKKIPKIKDNRGEFVEFAKQEKFGQVSYFSINPLKKRGDHYHNTKLERFIVLSGKVKFNLQNLNDGLKKSIILDENKIIEIPPGWAHNIENLSKKKIYLIVWANEVFDKLNPDTIRKIVL